MLRTLFSLLVLVSTGSLALAQAPLAGSWPQGSWQSDRPQAHHGPLHATFTPINDSQYQVRFGGRFAKVIPFRYTVVLDVTGTDGNVTTLSGSSKLPLFGTFTYNAVATPNSFEATYSSRRDTGRFLLSR